jgi:hypothetical protein
MNPSLLSRRARPPAQAILLATLLGSLTGCTHFSDHVEGTPPPRAAAHDTVTESEDGTVHSGSALDSQLAGLNRQIEGRKEYNAKLRELVATKEQQLATVLAADRSAGPTVLEFDLRTSIIAEAGKIDRIAPAWQETIDAHKAVLKGASGDPRSAELEAEINRLAAERAELLRQRTRLLAINDKLAK